MAKKKLKFDKTFDKNYGTFTSPIVLDLMGSYIEHTGGNKLICFLDKEICAKVNRKQKQTINIIINNEEHLEIKYNDIKTTKEKTIENIIKLAILELKKHNVEVNIGLDILLDTYSEYTGLNLAVSYIWLFLDIISLYNHTNLKKDVLIEYANNILNGLEDTNIPKEVSLYNCNNNSALYQNIRKKEIKHSFINFDDFNIVICYDNEIKKDLTDLYKERISDSISAHMIIDSKFKHEYLSDFNMYELNEVKEDIRDFEFKRMRHAISENIRVDELFKSLLQDDIVKTGMLLSQSNLSISQDYEITTNEQNSMFSLVSNCNVLGAKMIASKYNSSIFMLVKEIQIPSLIKEVTQLYKERFKSNIEFLICNIN